MTGSPLLPEEEALVARLRRYAAADDAASASRALSEYLDAHPERSDALATYALAQQKHAIAPAEEAPRRTFPPPTAASRALGAAGIFLLLFLGGWVAVGLLFYFVRGVWTQAAVAIVPALLGALGLVGALVALVVWAVLRAAGAGSKRG